MPWKSPSPQVLSSQHRDLWTQVKSECSKRGLRDRFELDFEIRFVLFVAENIDGLSQREEKNFTQLLAQTFEWSSFHLKMLEERIYRQSSFDLSVLRMSREIPILGGLVYQAALCMCLIDANLSEDEKIFLNNLKTHLVQGDADALKVIDDKCRQLFGLENQHDDFFGGSAKAEDGRSMETVGQESSTAQPTETVEDCLAELDQLTGLKRVKDEIKRLVSFLDIQRQRAAHQLPQAQLNHHMVFTGSPGTGKTTVARLVARIYRALGILKKGHLIETDRSGLVGQYIGHTENKTNSIINKALDGLLFIDEAYGLVKESENDFGHEAIDTLVKRMEDDRHRLVVIVAGYQQEMEDFLKANTGLQSRFNTFVAFEDYEPDELTVIFESLCSRNHYVLSQEAVDSLTTIFKRAIERESENFGNARYARNLFEASLRYQAFRLSNLSHAKDAPELSKDTLMKLEASDLLQGAGLA